MGPITSRAKFRKYFYGLTIKTKNFAFEAKVILGLEITCPDGYGAMIGLKILHDQ